MKIVINTDFGGFGLSQRAKDRYIALETSFDKLKRVDELCVYSIERNDPILVQVV